MTTPHLEDRLTRLADELVAPATPEVRTAIGRRARVLRRRRRTRQAVGAGIVVLAAIAGSLAVTRDTTPEAQTDWATDPSDLTAIVVDAEGWQVVGAQDEVPPDAPATGSDSASEQVFATPDEPAGPRIMLRHSPSSDAHGPLLPGEELVTIGDVDGLPHPTEPRRDRGAVVAADRRQLGRDRGSGADAGGRPRVRERPRAEGGGRRSSSPPGPTTSSASSPPTCRPGWWRSLRLRPQWRHPCRGTAWWPRARAAPSPRSP